MPLHRIAVDDLAAQRQRQRQVTDAGRIAALLVQPELGRAAVGQLDRASALVVDLAQQAGRAGQEIVAPVLRLAVPLAQQQADRAVAGEVAEAQFGRVVVQETVRPRQGERAVKAVAGLIAVQPQAVTPGIQQVDAAVAADIDQKQPGRIEVSHGIQCGKAECQRRAERPAAEVRPAGELIERDPYQLRRAGAEYVGKSDQFARIAPRHRQRAVVAGDVDRGGEAAAGIGVQPHPVRADQHQIEPAVADQIGQLRAGLQKLGRKRAERGKAAPAVVVVQGKEAGQPGLDADPVQPAVAGHVEQQLAGTRHGFGRLRQGGGLAVADAVRVRTGHPLRGAVQPGAGLLVQQPGQAIAVQIDQLVARRLGPVGQWLVLAIDGRHTSGIAEPGCGQIEQAAVGLVGAAAQCGQRGAEGRTVVAERQAGQQGRRGRAGRVAAEGQQLPAQPVAAQLEAEAVVGEGIGAAGPDSGRVPGRWRLVVGRALAVVEFERAQPAGIVGQGAEQVEGGRGGQIGVVDAVGIALGGLVAAVADAGAVLGHIAVQHVFAIREQ